MFSVEWYQILVVKQLHVSSLWSSRPVVKTITLELHKKQGL